ncbi:MAG: Lrp/AsnC family transcriptional regulator, partial [Acidimicrobiia bacterium]
MIDQLDARLIRVLALQPRIGVLELARRLEVARGTAKARLEKLQQRGIIKGFGPDIDLGALGYGVMAFTTIEIAQGRFGEVVEALRDIPEVV